MKLLYCISLLIILISCSDKSYNYNYILRSSQDSDNYYNVVMTENGRKLSVIGLYKDGTSNIEFYFLKKEGEFYSCDNSFLNESINDRVNLSTIKNYKSYKGSKYKGDSIIIEKKNSQYTTVYKVFDHGKNLKIMYFYDVNYKIHKIIFNNVIYEQ